MQVIDNAKASVLDDSGFSISVSIRFGSVRFDSREFWIRFLIWPNRTEFE